ncbi:helicase-related protein [Nocardioides pacificus]
MSDPLALLLPGTRVHGLTRNEVAEIVEVTRVGAGAYIRYRDDLGLVASRMLSEAELFELAPVASSAPTLDADIEHFRLAIEAVRIRHAHMLTPLLAVSSSNVEPLPHQVQAVYDHLLRNHPQRFLLADDPGAGKTVMAGLFIKEAMARGWVHRCLIVVPGSLAEQWQDELSEKFGLRFVVFDPSLVRRHAGTEDPLRHLPHLIVRLDQFARSQRLMDLVAGSTYDLAVVDEAHKLTARTWGNKLIKSKRFEFGERLRDLCPNLLLMTATPHNGKEAEFQLFLSLLREAGREEYVTDATSAGLMRRLVKEQLVHLDGSRLFPERRASTVAYRLSGLEHDLYEDVSEYVREEMNKVSGDDTKRTVGFALLVLQRRLASSPEAILRSLARRRDRLQGEALRVRDADDRLAGALAASLGLQLPDVDELSPADAEIYEDDTASVATAARTLEELETEIAILERLVDKAEGVRSARVDAKWEALAGLLTSAQMYDEHGDRRKIIIFTEHRDTLEYLEERLYELLPPTTGIEVIHGAISRPDRRLAQIRFKQEAASSILLATDAAGEGVNLQTAHLMVNYDIPWNPNRLEQRFGRIHRIGQRQICHLWNLVAVDTREGDVFRTLLDKLEVQREALGDQVFDVLGQVLTDTSLGQLLSRALEGADAAEIASALGRVSTDLESAVRERAASVSTLTAAELAVLRREMELARASSFQPSVIRDFTLTAMSRLRGDVAIRGDMWQIRHVPERVRDSPGAGVLLRYDLVTFEPLNGDSPTLSPPELLSPGHPLLSALVDIVDADFGDVLTQGALLEDDREHDDYSLVTLEFDIADDSLASLVTIKLKAGHELEIVDPALFTSLPPHHPTPTFDDFEAAAQATANALEAVAPRSAKVRAVAHVRGVASLHVAQSWQAARRSLRAELVAQGATESELVEAPPGKGWDFMVGTETLTFVSAVPAGHETPRRRAELHAAANVGAIYQVRVMTDHSCTES